MINDILDFSQISNGKLRLSYQNFSLWNTIEEVSKLLKFQAKQKGLEYILEKDPIGKDYLIHSDQNRIKQVLLNLLGNALKFTKKGSIKISLTVQTNSIADMDQNQPTYMIQVKDSGIGIKPEDQLKLFKLFGKLESGENNKINPTGVGLGLAISQSLVRVLNNHRKGGEISVSSEWGKGSVFQFLLYSHHNDYENTGLESKNRINDYEEINFIRNSKNPKSKTNIGVMTPDLPKQFLHFLIVDDDQINLLVVKAFLRGVPGISFETANNGQEAFDKFVERSKEGKKFDVILMDCNMPILDGFEATKLINQFVKYYSIREPWIIACTANASESDFILCFNSGMNDFISKPFTKKELLHKLENYPG